MAQDPGPGGYGPQTSGVHMDLGAIIGGGSSLLGDIFNLFGQSSAARQSQQWQRDTMDIQRQWALQDREHQEQYTAPEAQMARLKAAGLNPNLVYGEGVQATGQSEQPRPVQMQMPEFNGGLGAFANLGGQFMEAAALGKSLNKTSAETENIKAQYKGILFDNVAKDLANTITKTNPRSDPAFKEIFQDYDINKTDWENEILHGQSKAAKLLAEKVATEIDNMREGNTRDWLKNTREQLYNAQSIQNMQQTLSNLIAQHGDIDADVQLKVAQVVDTLAGAAGKSLDNANKADPMMGGQSALKHLTDMIMLFLAAKGLKGSPTRNPIGFKY